MKKLRKNKKLVMGTSIVLTLIMILSATFAWFTAQDSVENKFKTGGIPEDTVKVWEIFEEPDEWKPGQEVQKDVGVANLGKEAIFVRASFEEMIQKLVSSGTQLTVTSSITLLTDEDKVPVPVSDYSDNSDWKEATASGSGYEVNGLDTLDKLYVREEGEQIFYTVVSSQGGKISSKDITIDVTDPSNKVITVVEPKYDYYTKDSKLNGDWVVSPFKQEGEINVSKIDSMIELAYHTGNMSSTPTADKWFYNEDDGWFYYVTPLAGGTITPYFLTSVTLKGDANNTYQYLDYSLTVKTEGIQGTKEALATWGITESSNKPLYDAMVAGLGA